MNLFIREMKAHRKSLLLWSAAVLFMVFAGMGKYAGMASSGQTINDMIADMPKSLQAIMGSGALDLSTASGYFGVLYLYLLLMSTIHAAMLGADIVAKEERDATAEFLMSKPISRSRVLTAKLLAAFVNILIVNAATTVSSLAAMKQFGDGENASGEILLLMAGMLVLQMFFAAVGSAIAAASRQPKRSATYSAGILLAAFLLSVAIDMSNGRLSFMKFATPFKYFEASQLLEGGGLDAWFLALSLSIAAFLLVAAYVSYERRDLQI
jgi:ABC-2 type transport system permease protein